MKAFFGTFYVTCILFAMAFWIICYAHGDFDYFNSGSINIKVIVPLLILYTFYIYFLMWIYGIWQSDNQTFIPCLNNVTDFTSVFLFSLEIQTTIGFGYMIVTEQCFPAVITLTIQMEILLLVYCIKFNYRNVSIVFKAILGAIIETFLVGVVFAKIIRTKQRAQAIVFSRRAVICNQDGLLCLICFVWSIDTGLALLAPDWERS